MNEQETKLSPKSLTHLFITLARSRRNILENDRKKADVMQHLEKIKQISERTTKRSLILEELQKIESKVSELAEKQTSDDSMLRRLQQKYEVEMPRQTVKSLHDFETVSFQLGENVQKLRKIQTEEEPKIEIIQEEKDRVNELKQIEGQLKIIEMKYNRLKKNKKYASDIRGMKAMIDRYKKMILEIKSGN